MRVRCPGHPRERVGLELVALLANLKQHSTLDHVARLKEAFADLSRRFFRVAGRVKISVLLGFTVAAHHLDRVRSFRAKQAEEEHRPKYRTKRRLGIQRDLIDSTAQADPEDDRAPPG